MCILLGHPHGCWLLNDRYSPVRPLWAWAIDLRWHEERRHRAAQIPDDTDTDHPYTEAAITAMTGGTTLTVQWPFERPK